MNARLPWLSLAVLLAALSAAPAGAQALVVVDDDQDVSGGVLRLGKAQGDCCGTGPCHGNFRLDNRGPADLGRIDFSASDLIAGGQVVPAASVEFSPQGLPQLGVHGSRVITVKLSLPPSTPAGTYRGSVTAAERDGSERVELPVEVVVCGGTSGSPELALVSGLGSYDGTLVRLAPGAAGCAAGEFRGEVTLENRGSATAPGIHPALDGLPAGSSVSFDPAELALGPGARAAVQLVVRVADALPPGEYGGLLSLRDAPSGSAVQAETRFTRCAAPRPELRIVHGTEGIPFLPGPQGCSGTAFQAEVQIEAGGEVGLAAVELSLEGLPPGVTARFEPPSAGIPAGGSVRFRATLLVPAQVPAGTHQAVLSARDSPSGARDSSPASFARCHGGSGGLRIVAAGGASAVRFAPGREGCAGTTFVAAFEVESIGTLPLAAVTLSARGFPGGSVVSFSPASFPLGPGARMSVTATLSVPAATPAGLHAGLLSAGGASGVGEAAASFERCAPPDPKLRIVLAARRDAISLVAGPGGCSAPLWEGWVEVENPGQVALARVGLLFPSTPGGIELSATPASQPIAAGATARFQVSARVAATLAAGTWKAVVVARDAASSAADSALLRLERCAAQVEEPPPGEPREPREPGEPGEPGDEGVVRLLLEHRASRAAARSGELVTFTIRVRNAGTGRAASLRVSEELPRGFALVSHRSSVDGQVAEDPRSGTPLTWDLGGLGPGEERVLAFQSVVGPAAALGAQRARASAHAGGAAAGPVDVLVEVTRAAFRPFGELRGRVRYQGGAGVPGVRFLLDGDREASSDEEGRFQFEGLPGGEHLVSLDPRTLAPGDRVDGSDFRELRVFDGASEEVEFLLLERPLPGLALFRVTGPADR